MASVFPNVSRPEPRGLLGRALMRRGLPAKDPRLDTLLAAVDESLRIGGSLDTVIDLLEESKRALFEFLRTHFESPAVAKALALKAINICVAKQHYRARSTALLSRPFGLIADPSNSCNLACPGCVHSEHAKERKVFEWGTGTMPLHRMSRFLSAYGPYAVHVNFCNYGEPLVNPLTPKFIREAKGNLVQSMLSTNLSLPRLDCEALVASGLDYMLVSVDGATQPVYEKFRRKGHLDVVLRNIERLVKAKRESGKKTPIIVWRMLTFEHNVHEIPLAVETARQLGVDQFTTLHPFEVTWDEPDIRVADVETVNVQFNPRASLDILDNWNAFPDGLDTASIDRAFDSPWVDKAAAAGLPAEFPGRAGPGASCTWLYKSVSIDANGRIIPCCASPRPDADLVFADFDSTPTLDVYNSEKYRLSRLSFVDMDAYKREFAQSGLAKNPYCAKCDWDKEATNTNSANIRNYFQGASRELFNPASMGVLADW